MSAPANDTEPTNTNCLEGMACPSCKSKGDFIIGVFVMALVSDNGVVDPQSPEWDDASTCACRVCTFEGKVSDFKAKETTTAQPDIDLDPDAPTKCPKCGTDLGDYVDNSHELNLEESEVFQEVHCPDDECGHRWYDIYRFAATMECGSGKLKDYRPNRYHLAVDLLDVCERLANYLGETHTEGSAKDHCGDAECSYCDILTEAQALITKAEA